MSDEMSPWRSLASAASRSVKSYVVTHDPRRGLPQNPSVRPAHNREGSYKQSWSQWASHKLKNMAQNYEASQSAGLEQLSLFPGWAARRYREAHNQEVEGSPFDIEVFVSGFSSRSSGAGFTTRGGKAFLRLAKSYASLPKLMTGSGVAAFSTEEPLERAEEAVRTSVHLPPRPDEINEQLELQELEQQLRKIELDEGVAYSAPSSVSSQNSSSSSARSDSGSHTPLSDTVARNIQAWHANLEARLRPFWSSTLSNRTVRISVYASDERVIHSSPPLADPDDDEYDAQRRPIATRDILTSADGSFQVKLALPWERMCVHPAALHIAFGDPCTEPNLLVMAQLLPQPSRPPTPNNVQPMPHYFTPTPHRSIPTVTTDLSVPLTHTPIRVISDIDDTVKLSGILQGARAVFHNVFVKDLSENVIPGMGDWYTSMWGRGARFHYVSNGPFELLPVVNNFFQLSHLPPGSVRLKSYAGRSLFNGIFSAPAERKRAGVVDILNNFPESQFILIGDSGEQDLELYASLAKSRPEQILAVFIRDARFGGPGDPINPLDDPTGDRVLRGAPGLGFGEDQSGSLPPGVAIPRPVASVPSGSERGRHGMRRGISRSLSEYGIPRATTRAPSRTHSYADGSSTFSSGFTKDQDPYIVTQPLPTPTMISDSPISEEPASFPDSIPTPSSSESTNSPPRMTRRTPPGGYFSSSKTSVSSRSSTLSSSRTGQASLSDAERKRWELQTRVYRARADVPGSIPIRVFSNPSECVEASNLFDKLHAGGGRGHGMGFGL